MNPAGRIIIIAGLLIVAVGLFVSFGDRLPFRLGRLPGDFSFGGKNSRFYFPLGTSILLSLILSLLAWLFRGR